MTKKEIKDTIIKDLREAFSFEENNVQERIHIDMKTKEITVKFSYKIDMEDNQEFITFV